MGTKVHAPHRALPQFGGAEKRHLLGTHRLISPSETVENVKPWMSRMGITRVANVTGLDRIGVPVVMVCRPNSRSLAVSQGKGVDLAAATASGVMEATELYHAENIELPLKLAAYSDLAASHPLVDVDRLPHVSAEPFNRNVRMLWVAGIDLMSSQDRWVPFESVRTDFTMPPLPGSGWFDCSSNGLASGNCLAEAICHGICEVIERDATTLWNCRAAGAKADTGLNLATVKDRDCKEVLARLSGADFETAVWETTTDIGIPSFFALIVDRHNPTSHFGIGAGTHLSPTVALLRALTEAIQVRTTYISGARDDLSPDEYSDAARVRKRHAADRLLCESSTRRNFDQILNLSQPSFDGDLRVLLNRLRAAGVTETVAVDLSKGWPDIAVARVLVPGIEGPDDHDSYMPGERALRARKASG
jgi:ribosomal protein S12 methylthiotransferase accessory factor